MTKIHWREMMGKTYLVGEVLNGQDVKITIEGAKKEPVIDVQETKKQHKEVFKDEVVLRFKGTDYKLILNVINATTISKVLKSSFPNDWIGQQITLVPLKGRWFGKDQTAIRIKQDFSNVKM